MVRRDPARYKCVNAHPRQADLALGAIRMLEGKCGQLLFMCAPPHLGRGRPLFPKALNAPGINEFVHLFRLVRDLRVAFAAMDDLDTELVGQVIKILSFGVMSNLLPLGAAKFFFRECSLSDIQECVFSEMADQTWVCSVFDYGRWP